MKPPLRVEPSYNSGEEIHGKKRVLAKSGGPLDAPSLMYRKPKSAQRTSGLPTSHKKNQIYNVDVQAKNNLDHINLDSQHINIAWNPENGKFTTFTNKKHQLP